MPYEYERIRDSLLRQGYDKKEAKRLAAAIYNKRHPEDPVHRSYDSTKKNPPDKKSKDG